MNTASLNIFNYHDYCNYLNDWHNKKSLEKNNWSIGMFAKLAGLSNTAAMTNILRGRKVPSQRTIESISKVLKHNQRESIYFNALVETHRHNKQPLIQTSLRKFISLIKPQSTQKEISDNIFSKIHGPIYFAIREIVKIKSFTLNPSWIKNRLTYSTSEEEITKAISVLINIGLLKKNDKDELYQVSDFYETKTEIPSDYIKKFHKKSLSHAINMIDKIEVKDRFYSSDTIAISSKDIPKIKEYLELTRKEVCQQFEKEKDLADEVYHINLQLVPATKKDQ